MNVKIQGGGKGLYSNTGSCIGVTNYLQHEELDRLKEGQTPEPFFTHNKDQVSASEVTYKIDHNKAQLHKTDSKFFVLTISPSQEEIRAMGSTDAERSINFKKYINEGVMANYAQNFQKGLEKEYLMYYAKIHHSRDEKLGDQMHAHIIVSRKDINNKIKLSPQTNHRGKSKGAVKSGFDRTAFFKSCESIFDKEFSFKRDFKDTFEYQNAMKNGSLNDVVNLIDKEKEHVQKLSEMISIKEQPILNIEQTRGRSIR